MRLGSDPEVLLLDQQGNFKSIIGMVGADKWNPLQVDNMAKGFTFQEDNVALEFGIPPAASADEFVHHITAVQQEFLKRQPKYSFSQLSCTIFPDSEMDHPGAHMFGCEPDFNAWTGKENSKPKPEHANMRSAGGHVHVETDLDRRSVIRAMDVYLGVPSTKMDKLGSMRRGMYGKEGAFRSKPYGVEYRVLSNFWIFEEKYIRWVWRATEAALKAVSNGVDFKDKAIQKYVSDAISGNDIDSAEALIDEFNLEVVE